MACGLVSSGSSCHYIHHTHPSSFLASYQQGCRCTPTCSRCSWSQLCMLPGFMPYSPGLLGMYCLKRQQFPQIANVWWHSAGPRLPLSCSPHIGIEWCWMNSSETGCQNIATTQPWWDSVLGMICSRTHSWDIAGPNWNVIHASDMVDYI